MNALANAYPNLGGAFEIHTLYFTLARFAAADASLAALEKFRKAERYPPGHDDAGELKDIHIDPQLSGGPVFLRADLVGADEGNPRYRNDDGALIAPVTDPADGTRDTWADTTNRLTNPGGYPNVVSITKLTGTSRDITIPETGPFDVKIVLTEEPHASYTGDNGTKLVEVTGGRATGITKGLTFGSGGEGPRRDETAIHSGISLEIQ